MGDFFQKKRPRCRPTRRWTLKTYWAWDTRNGNQSWLFRARCDETHKGPASRWWSGLLVGCAGTASRNLFEVRNFIDDDTWFYKNYVFNVAENFQFSFLYMSSAHFSFSWHDGVLIAWASSSGALRLAYNDVQMGGHCAMVRTFKWDGYSTSCNVFSVY